MRIALPAMAKRFLAGAALLIAATVPLFAAETLTVHYVEVPVSVVGPDGKPVRGLTKANFQLFDGRRPVDIASFDAIDFDSPASVRANASTPAVHRSFLILFDLTYSSTSSLVRAQAAARAFVQKNFRASDLVGVATIDVLHGYHLVTNFTTDRNAVAAAIDHPAAFRGADPLQLAGTQNYNKLEADQDLMQLPPGKYAIKTLVRTPATEQNGYVRSDVIVPRSGETVLLSPFVLDDPQAWLLINGDRDHTYPFHVNGMPFVPSASGAMPTGSVHKLVVFVCNALPEELKWETAPQATLLGQFKTVDATKLILQLDDATASRFGVMVKKGNEAPLTATISLNQRP